MSSWTRIACIALAVGMAWAGNAHAQPGVGAYRMDRSQTPGFSPYLNLLRGGNSPAINYYGIVRPEITFGNSLYQLGVEQKLLQGQQSDLGNQQSALAAYTALPATGHSSGFMTQSKFFMTNGGAGQGNTFAPGGFGQGVQMQGRPR